MQVPNNLASLQEALDKLPQKKITQVIIVLLIGYIAYVLAQITWLLAPQPQIKSSLPVAVHSMASSSKTINLSGIKALNLFGQYQAVADNKPKTIQVQDAPETRLNLKLSGVVATQNENTAAAIIENSGRQETYGIGDQITGTRASIDQILPDRVLIKQSGRLETLMLDGFEFSKTVTQPQPIAVKTQDNAQLQTNTSATPTAKAVVDQRKNRELSQQISGLRKDIAQNPKKVLDYFTPTQAVKNGKLIGYRLSPSGNNSLFKAAGLKRGDIAIEINGFDLTQLSEASQALKALRQEQEVSLLIQRGDELKEILFSIDNG